MGEDVKDRLNENLENAEVLSHEEISPGKHELEIAVGPSGPSAGTTLKGLAYLDPQRDKVNPLRFHTGGRVITRDYTRRVDLDLLSSKPNVIKAQPQRIFQQAIDFYKSKGPYGTWVDTLSNFAAKGFKNDIDDEDIKLFYDTWGSEINFQETVEKIFFDFFRVGMVRTFKIVGKFSPKLKPENFDGAVRAKTQANRHSTTEDLKKLIAYRDVAAAKKVWSKAFVPLQYTILNPTLIAIEGSLLFNQTETLLKPEAFKEIAKLLKSPGKATPEQRKFLSSLPKELKDAVKQNKPVKLPPELVGKCDYRRMDYERYPQPKVARMFDDLGYKDELKKADYSTLDGITNYILKITIGNDQHPVTSQDELVAIANLFDTPSKSFDIVWNHTLQVEKITFPEIDKVLGIGKFEQVNDDLSQSMGVTRALIDGDAKGNAKGVEAALKGFGEEINYARRCVKRWIDNEYEEVALAMGFNRYPTVRFDENALKDEIMMMSVVQGMIDRRIISYETGIEKLGFDFSNELANFIQEKPLVQDGTFGIIGSPYNPKALPAETTPTQKDITPSGKDTTVTKEDLNDFRKNITDEVTKQVQKIQRTPKGTPSEGRPRKGRGKPKQKSTTPNIKPRKV